MNPEKRNALISVFNKTGIVEFARKLIEMNWQVFASRGSAEEIAGAEVRFVGIWLY